MMYVLVLTMFTRIQTAGLPWHVHEKYTAYKGWRWRQHVRCPITGYRSDR